MATAVVAAALAAVVVAVMLLGAGGGPRLAYVHARTVVLVSRLSVPSLVRICSGLWSQLGLQ